MRLGIIIMCLIGGSMAISSPDHAHYILGGLLFGVAIVYIVENR